MVNIRDCIAYGGPAYPIMTEDGPSATIPLLIGATALDGRRFVHNSSFPQNDPERADRFAARVTAAGQIDPAHWTELPPAISTEERFARLAEMEQMERAGYDVSFWGDLS